MTVTDIFDTAKIAALTVVAWLVPPGLWRKVARATSSIGRDDRSGPAYQRNLAHKYSQSDIAALRRRRRTYLRELKFQILGLIGPWRSWHPHIHLVGTANLQKALEAGRGAILWVTDTVFSTLVTKMALHDAGYQVLQLSRSQHGFSMSPFGVRFLNPIWVGVEDRFIAGRVVIKGDTATDVLPILRERMAENKFVIIVVVPQAHKFIWVPLLRDIYPLPTGPIRLARSAGAPILPVFTVATGDGGYDVSIHEPVYAPAAPANDESVAQAYARQLQGFVDTHPDQWNGWQWLTSRERQGL
ncbi:MAG: lysophospholipid acyltransferase family protein [Xanthobacteraceae bacterium]